MNNTRLLHGLDSKGHSQRFYEIARDELFRAMHTHNGTSLMLVLTEDDRNDIILYMVSILRALGEPWLASDDLQLANGHTIKFQVLGGDDVVRGPNVDYMTIDDLEDDGT